MDDVLDIFSKAGLSFKRESDEDRQKEYESWIRADEKIEESALDPIQQKLEPQIWDKNNKLKSSVRDFILKTFDKWRDQLKTEFEIKKIVFMGSSAGYQYTANSDVDIHVYVDLPQSKLDELSTGLPRVDIPHTHHPIEFYIEKDDSDIKHSDSAYDLLKNKWITPPKKRDVQIPFTYIIEIARFFIAGIEDRINEYERDKVEIELYKHYMKSEETTDEEKKEYAIAIERKEEEIRADLDALHVAKKLMKAFRGEAYSDDKEENEFTVDIKSKDPNFSINNLVYKMIDKFGYIDKLRHYAKLREDLMNGSS